MVSAINVKLSAEMSSKLTEHLEALRAKGQKESGANLCLRLLTTYLNGLEAPKTEQPKQ